MATTRVIKLIVYNYGETMEDKNIRYVTFLKTWHERDKFVGAYRAVRKELRLTTGRAVLPEEIIDTMTERGYCKSPIKMDEEYIVKGK